MQSATYQELHEHIDQIWVFDTHEHMPTEREWLAVPENRLDFSQLMHYVELDVVSSGMPVEDMNKVRFSSDLSEDEKWALFEPYWPGARNTAFAQVVEQSVRDFYGLPCLSRDTYKEIGRCIRQTRRPGRYRRILKDIARIELALLDTGCEDPDRDLFLPVRRLDHFLWLTGQSSLRNLENRLSASIGSLADLEEQLGRSVQDAKHRGIVAIKTAQSYCRSLRYEHVEREVAASSFDRLFASSTEPDERAIKVLSDYLFYRLVELCIEHGLPIQIHTGMNAGNAVSLEPTNPMFLTEVFLRYPEARFDLFHAGFPFWEEMGVLVKTFPNTRADMCWTHIVSPSAARRALGEWLELVPANKIFGFGGDLGSVEIAATHLKIARANIAAVLAAKVDSGSFTMEQAKDIARMILHDNAASFYGLTPPARA